MTPRANYFAGRFRLDPIYDKQGCQAKKHWLWWRVPLWEFTNDPDDPLTYRDGDGTDYQPDRHYLTDGGSIPPPLWGLGVLQLSPWAFPRPYSFHDCGFQYGGLYVRRPAGIAFVFERMTRQALNALLCRMIRADGGTPFDAGAVGAGLAIGSRFAWDEKRQAKARRAAGIG